MEHISGASLDDIPCTSKLPPYDAKDMHARYNEGRDKNRQHEGYADFADGAVACSAGHVRKASFYGSLYYHPEFLSTREYPRQQVDGWATSVKHIKGSL